MTQNSADRTRIDRRWLDAAELAQAEPDARVRAWLVWEGLLTAALREACGGEFRLQLLRQRDAELDEESRRLLGDGGERGLCREIVMGNRQHRYVYARTWVPEATATAHPWLRTLGEDSLGERLRHDGSPPREAFRFALLEPADRRLAGLVPAPSEALWARHSVFRLAGGPLSLLEVFLPAILRCELPR